MIEGIGRALLDWIVSANLWTAVLLAGALILDRLLSRRVNASVRMVLYVPIVLRLVVPMSWSLPVLPAPRAAVLLPLDRLSATPVMARAAWHGAVAVAHVAVAAFVGLRAIARHHDLLRAVSSAKAVGLDAPCPVLRHPELGPMVVGLRAPQIVIPEAMIEPSKVAALACVLKHEVAHVRRRDPWLSAAMHGLLAVAWPVLPLWVAVHRVRHLMELACDEAALVGADADERRRYGHVLLDVADQGHLAFAAAGSLHFGSVLRARVEAIVLQRPWPRALQVALVSGAGLAFGACSSAGPAAVPEPSRAAHAARAGEGVDEYGYQYESDPVQGAACDAGAAPTRERSENGRLAPELIQAVVRKSFGRFRGCYEAALKTNAKLEGRVTVGFNINPDGSVSHAKDEGSTLADETAVQCVVDGFGQLAFPAPEGGYVTVIYPIEFNPGD